MARPNFSSLAESSKVDGVSTLFIPLLCSKGELIQVTALNSFANGYFIYCSAGVGLLVSHQMHRVPLAYLWRGRQQNMATRSSSASIGIYLFVLALTFAKFERLF